MGIDLNYRQALGALAQAEPSVLEIGPFWCPSVRGDNVRYFDVIGRDDLVQKAIGAGVSPEDVPGIHYVSQDSDLAIVDRQFSAVFSAHCIEHQPDLIGHLRAVRKILKPGGKYYLVVPDKRYCFDHFQPESSADEVIEAIGNSRHTMINVVKHFSYETHNDASRHWNGDHADPGYFEGRISRARWALDLFERAAGAYLDVHAWQFTPASFSRIISEIASGTGMRPTFVGDTPHGLFEFTAILTPA